MLSLSFGGLLALISLVVCSSRGLVARGFLAGALVLALGGAAFMIEMAAVQAQLKHELRAAQVGYVLVCTAWLGQLVVMALAVSSQPRPRPPVVRRRKRRRLPRRPDSPT